MAKNADWNAEAVDKEGRKIIGISVKRIKGKEVVYLETEVKK